MNYALLGLIIVGSIGLITIVTGILIKIITKKRISTCTSKAIGRVVNYKFLGKSNFYPQIEFEVEGVKYITRLKFNGVKNVRKIGSLFNVQEEAWEDDKGYLCIKVGFISNLKSIAEKMWPIGKEMEVFYNPQNPNINYAVRPITNNFLYLMFVLMGIFTIIMSVVVYLLLLNK